MAENPFHFTGPVPPEELIDRGRERATLLTGAREGNNSRIMAPRRYGKTSLLRAVAREFAVGKFVSVYVDFFGVLTPADVASRIDRAYSQALAGKLASWIRGVLRTVTPFAELGGGPIPGQAGIRFNAVSMPDLDGMLRLPERVYQKTGKRVLVVFDEFQELLSLGRGVDGSVRAVIQHQVEAASYIFAGSNLGMMRELFEDPKRAFYQQAQALALDPLPADEAAEYLVSSFRATNKEIDVEAIDLTLQLSVGHPQRTMMLAHGIWGRTPDGGTADATIVTDAHAKILAQLADEFRGTWARLATPAKRILTAVALGVGPYSREVSVGQRGGSRVDMLTALTNSGDLIMRHDSGGKKYVLVDPFLAQWLRSGRESGT
jgi:hypothetical protein